MAGPGGWRDKEITDLGHLPDKDEESSDNDEVFHPIQAEVRVEQMQPNIPNPVENEVPDGFKVGKISPPVYLTNEWPGCNSGSEVFWNEWLTPTPVIQPPKEDGDYVELYDAGAAAAGNDGVSNGAYEDTYDHSNGNDDLDYQVAQENYVCEDQDVIDNIDNSVDGNDTNCVYAPSCSRLFSFQAQTLQYSSSETSASHCKSFGLLIEINTGQYNELQAFNL
ncbi:Nik-related protein kinase [Fukomys damarensis]|uniref:Nik-related protein kinase n=1 Tax=Fukomys damarensis TaxID=885580 RepID=A0A091DXZ5_FUKDA|nr:Nik-related protein kinase [Fukomys damarensis]